MNKTLSIIVIKMNEGMIRAVVIPQKDKMPAADSIISSFLNENLISNL